MTLSSGSVTLTVKGSSLYIASRRLNEEIAKPKGYSDLVRLLTSTWLIGGSIKIKEQTVLWWAGHKWAGTRTGAAFLEASSL